MARMNLYVPNDLKRRMDKVRDPVSWSAIAAQAFEQELGELAAKKHRKRRADVIQRLRSSKLTAKSELAKRGRVDGRCWAEESAEADELQHLAALFTQGGREVEAVLAPARGGSPGDAFFRTIRPDEEGGRRVAGKFWKDLLGASADAARDSGYVIAFADAAVELWNEVEDKV